MNKKNLTAETVQKLEMLLFKGEKQLEKRMDQLDVWKDNEYNESLNKLKTWEKQLILNAKHQKNSLKRSDDYGKLLWISQYSH